MRFIIITALVIGFIVFSPALALIGIVIAGAFGALA